MNRKQLLSALLVMMLSNANQTQAYEIVTNSNEFCSNDAVCEWPETSSICPSDCGVIGISKYTSQRAKYIDQSCQYNGDGLSNTCASSNGGSGKFNELQSALDSLRSGDTLYVYPGEYYRSPSANRIYSVNSSGTEDRPVIITAYDVNDRPILKSFGPNGSGMALGTDSSSVVHHVIFDHLFIDGQLSLEGDSNNHSHHNIMQFNEGITGWGSCDGNWAVFRMHGCDDCVVHHNYAHDIEGTSDDCNNGINPRGAGLKEFYADRAVWEFNTIEGARYYGYDLHHSSHDTTVRFNQFIDTKNFGIRFGDRLTSPRVYGNIVHNAEFCMQHAGSNAVSHDEIFNNVCSFTTRNLIGLSDINLDFHDNIVSNTIASGNSTQNLGVQPRAAGVTATMDYNAYDSGANFYYGTGLWGDGPVETSLAAWRSRFPGQEQHSQEAAGGVCGFVDAPTSASDMTFDLTPIDAFCATGSSEGGLLGPYGLVSCIGYTCGDVDGTIPEDPTSNPIDLSENSYVSLNPRMRGAAVVSLADNNVITAGDRTLQLDLYQHGSLYNANEDVIPPGMVITGTAPFDLGSGVSGTDTPVHASMLGREFVMPHSRGNHTYHMISPQGNANVQITLEGTTSAFTLTQGEPFNLETGEVNGNVGAIITSDAPILVSHTALVSWGEADASPIPPAARELWGVCSGHAHVSAAEDNTLVRIYSSTGSTKSVTLNAGEKRSICPSLPESERNQGRGPALHIVAENSVGAVQIGDGDGGDQTAFYPTSLLNSRFGIPKSSQYVAITCPADASITLYQPNGTTDTRDCNADGNHPGKVLFGDPATSGAHIAEGSYLESTSPVYVIYEVTDSNDEHNLIGVSAYVTPIFSTGMEGGASDWMYPRTVQGGGGATITFPSVNNNPVAQFNCRAGSSNEVWLSHYFGDHEFSREEPVDELWLNLEYRISSTSIYSPNAGSASKILYFNWSSPTDRTRTSQVVLSAIDSGSGHSFRLSKEVFNVDGSWRPGGELWDDPTADLIPVNEKLYLQLHVRNSTNGAANGIVQLYNNGELVFERRNVVLNEYGHSPNVFDLTPQVSATPPGSAGNGYVQYDNVSLYTNNPGPFTAP